MVVCFLTRETEHFQKSVSVCVWKQQTTVNTDRGPGVFREPSLNMQPSFLLNMFTVHFLLCHVSVCWENTPAVTQFQEGTLLWNVSKALSSFYPVQM